MDVDLTQRLADFKVMRKAVLEGERENGYRVTYYRGDILFDYEELDKHLVIRKRINNNLENLKVLNGDEEEKAKELCYRKILDYLMRNTHIEDGKILDKSTAVWRNEEGKITSYILLWPRRIFYTKFGELPKKMQDRINRKRVDRGLGLATVREVA